MSAQDRAVTGLVGDRHSSSRRAGARAALLLGLAALHTACAAKPLEIGREPDLSAVGSGLRPEPNKESLISHTASTASPVKFETSSSSLWKDRAADFFKDPRARRPGDIMTVTISVKDKASFDNSSKRSRDASHGFGLDMSHKLDLRGATSVGSAKADSSLKSNTAQDGKGATARSESIELRVAAVVTGVLPNGNVLIQGTQELRVNYELRVLTVTGIVNIVDIKADNTISYERIAEARMSYGGRGRIMEVQQPAWGHQIIDLVFPF